MPVALLGGILSIIEKMVPDPQKQAEIKAQVQAAFFQYQSDFISKTSDALNRALRVAIVAAFSAALFVPVWGDTLARNAARMPIYFWLIIGWEFYGAAMLQALPWFKNGSAAGAVTVAANDPLPRGNIWPITTGGDRG